MNIPFPKTRLGTFFLSVVTSILFPIMIIYLYAWQKIITGSNGTVCNEAGIGSCSPMHEAGFTLGLYFFLTVVSFGLTIILPTLIFWVIFEFFRK